jgi:hypothetical protein
LIRHIGITTESITTAAISIVIGIGNTTIVGINTVTMIRTIMGA